MKRITLIIALIFGCVAGCMAENVSQKQAMELARLFFNEAAGRVTAPPKLVYNGRRLTTNRLFVPFYVYNTPLGGFVIISAENKTFPILGFSLKESFNPEDLGPSETALLKSYAREIELIRYDSQPVERAIHAWQNYAEYVDGILKANYEATDPKISIEECRDIVDRLVENEDITFSDIYTPEQWLAMIAEDLKGKKYVAASLIDTDQLFPIVIYGRQGDYFRIEMTRRNSWLMRLNATETIPSNMVAALGNPIPVGNVDVEERPFEDHDSFLTEVIEIEEQRRSKPSIDIIGTDGEPLVIANGGGHFEVVMSGEVATARVYNLAGAMVRRFSYNDTNVANIDLSAEPFGFYIVTITTEEGEPFGLKIYR